MRRHAAAAIAYACCSHLRIVSCDTVPIGSQCHSPDDLSRGLNNLLSSQAVIYTPGSPEFEKATTRWSELETPTVDVVVVPATEDDVAHVVRFAASCDLPILAYNGVHGAITTLGKMNRGVAIQLSQLSSVVVAKDGTTATIGGGTSSKAVIDALWAVGKQTVTGTCECVSYLGPSLGGGHGWLQGHYGLIADQLVSMSVVLADGSLHTIDPSSDLWWAMKGAGQNFGIVTSATAKVYDIEHRDWAIETFIFTGDKVKAVYEAAKKHLSNPPVGVINWSYWLNIAEIDPEKPIVLFYIIQEGVTVVDPVYTAPFRAIGPVSTEPLSGDYRDLAGWVGIALDSPPCQKSGLANPRFPIYFDAYDAAAQAEAYDLFATHVGGAASPFNRSLFMFEGYPTQGVRAVDAASSAFAFRGDSILGAPLLTYKSRSRAGAGSCSGEPFDLDRQAARLGNQLRDILRRGSGRKELHSYVNYAYGDEGPESWYGYEGWRRKQLRGLKDKYDPRGRFSFFGPVA